MSKENERVADDFDRKLFGLIETAKARSGCVDPFAERWSLVALALVEARPTVRGMMSATDRKATS